MRPWVSLLVLASLKSGALGQAQTPLNAQPSSSARETAASPSSALLSAPQQMTSDCSSFPFTVSTPLYAVGGSTGTNLAIALTGCLGQSACQVSVSRSASCSTGSLLHANSLSAPQQNCTASEQSVFVCKSFAVSPELYQKVASGSCNDDWQQQTVMCSGTQLQRSLYQAILSGGVLAPRCNAHMNVHAALTRNVWTRFAVSTAFDVQLGHAGHESTHLISHLCHVS